MSNELFRTHDPRLLEVVLHRSRYENYIKIQHVIEKSKLEINPLNMESIDLNKLWAHYDDEADSMVIYLTGGPVRAVSVLLDEDTYVKVDPATGEIVGFHVEGWERQFVPEHPDIRSSWKKITPRTANESEWRHILNMMALWLVFVFKSDYMPPLANNPA